MTAVAFAVILLLPAPEKAPVPIFTRIDTEMFPEEWVAGAPGANATSLPDYERDRSIRVVTYALTKYPEEFLKTNLRKIYVVASLEFYGLSYGGTNSSDTVYLSNKGARNGFTDRYMESSFHHEFSSILLRNGRRSFNRRNWTACNDPKVPYQGDGMQALRDGTADLKYRDAWHERGFLAEYATASIEEDFNMMAEGLFSGDPRFWRAVDNYPRIRKKATLAVEFYHSLNETFTEQKFRAMQPVD